ncbi:sigma 54-interacting transcriptional regulator [Lacibacter sediminis]|uniref:Sigma 54-interacting transcriptional regulator n=1 Tax=Lacibacter sediminis TaxID=2760713 RepID=A0A7G5XK71_9BACT|nr:sigma 54-interacting transcriptional regulator [Lacibacter sediminis]QNA45874.1 sigma 54-interacting transcriptional regulator [Lacibacter sediminis]
MNKRIVIVEDEFIVAEDLTMIAEKAGYTVPGTAASVEEAILLINQYKPDLVLLDINLEGKLTGIDLAHKLREENIAFIYISAYSTQSILEAANATQPYGFLVKPFREKDVFVALDIARYRCENSLESALLREQSLTRTLETIHYEAITAEEKLFKIVNVLQTHIPFDYLTTGKITNGEIPYEGIGFVRQGAEQYQAIGIPELLKLTGINMAGLKKIQESAIIGKKPALYNGEDFIKVRKENPFKNLLAHTFKLHANLFIPFTDLNNETCIFSFYSRKKDAYNAAHIRLLGRLHNYLINTCEYVSLLQKNTPPTTQAGIHSFEGIVGNHPALVSILDLLKQVAPFDTSVLIQGETGTGKERIASCIHQLSGKSAKPFVKINCAVLSPALIESELFGYEKGAFTGAFEKRTGKFEQANGGTIFLDEIGELPLDMQTKLLRVLQEKEIERIGGKEPIKLDVRVIAATNRVLEKEVAGARFRMDLFYRLNVFPLTLPPLRERKSDIPQLAVYFAERFCKKMKKGYNGISDEMLIALMEHNWPGNIRELENLIEQSVLLNNGFSELELQKPLGSSGSPIQKRNSIDDAQSLSDIKRIQTNTEKEYIKSILKKSGGRIRGEGGAAQLLGIPPTTLESKMARLGIKKEED